MEQQYFDEPTLQADLRQYFDLLLQWAWLIILAAVLAGGAAYITSTLQDPVYQAKTKLLINEASSSTTSDYTAILTSERLARTYSELMTEEPILEAVIEELDLDLDQDPKAGNLLESLAEATEVQLIRDTQLIELSVENADPEHAALIANTIVAEFIKQNQALQSSRFAESKASLEAELARIQGQIHNTLLTIDALGDTQADQQQRDRLEADVAQYRQTHAGLLQSYEQIRVAEAQTTSNVIQVKPASAPDKPIRPRVLMNSALAAVVGGMLAVGAIFLAEALDDTLKNPDDIGRQLGLPILGTILKHEVQNGNPVTIDEPRSPTSEAYRALRTNIRYASVDTPIRSIVVTSPSSADGKSTIAMNLGVVLSQGGNRSILVDADMRRPTLHTRLKVPNRTGLSAFFVYKSLFRDIDDLPEGTILETQVEGLRVIPSGKIPPNPSELLSSARMSVIIERLKRDADFIIIDSPPVTAVTDSVVLAPRVDGVLLVIQPGYTRLAAAKHAVEQLRRVKANILGVVINNVEPKSSRYGYYYRYDRAYYAEDKAEVLRAQRRQGRLRWAVVGFITTLVLGLGGWYALSSANMLPVWLAGQLAPTPSPTHLPIAVESSAMPLSQVRQETPTPSLAELPDVDAAAPQDAVEEADQGPTPTATNTPTIPPPTPGPGLGTPFGAQGEYLLHHWSRNTRLKGM